MQESWVWSLYHKKQQKKINKAYFPSGREFGPKEDQWKKYRHISSTISFALKQGTYHWRLFPNCSSRISKVMWTNGGKSYTKTKEAAQSKRCCKHLTCKHCGCAFPCALVSAPKWSQSCARRSKQPHGSDLSMELISLWFLQFWLTALPRVWTHFTLFLLTFPGC